MIRPLGPSSGIIWPKLWFPRRLGTNNNAVVQVHHGFTVPRAFVSAIHTLSSLILLKALWARYVLLLPPSHSGTEAQASTYGYNQARLTMGLSNEVLLLPGEGNLTLYYLYNSWGKLVSVIGG